jgi:hypothetical protein
VAHLTAVGHVRLTRRVWWQAKEGVAAPADGWLNGGEARISPGARERCCRIGCHPQGFKRSAEDLKRLGGLSVSPERLRQIVEGEGQRAEAVQATGTLPPAWRAPACQVGATGPSRAYVGVDGVMVPMVTAEEKKKRAAKPQRRRGRKRSRCHRGHTDRYKEFKLATFYDQDKTRRHAMATGGGPEALGRILRREGRRFEIAEADEVVALVDGAPWIRSQLKKFRSCTHIGLDYYHFSEHVAGAAKAVFGEGSSEAAAWRERVLGLALEEGVDEVLDEVTLQRRQQRSPSKREALRRLRNYVGERTTMIRYPQNRSKGWDIGSGPTEALCKTMTARLKGSGMRWDPAGASAMLNLAALNDSNEWDAYWQFQGAHMN